LIVAAIASTMKAHLDLGRVSNLPTVWTNVLVGCLLSGARVAAVTVMLLAVSLSCFYLAGMALNDICDREHDRVHKPFRPIPSGKIPVRDARILTVALFAVGLGLLAVTPYLIGVGAALLLLAAIVLYDRYHKRNPLSVLLMASCRFLVYAVAAFAVSGRLAAAVVLAGSVQFAYIVALSLVARFDNTRRDPFTFPVIPALLAGICLLDGLMLAVFVGPAWGGAGAGGFLLTLAGQRYVRGD